MTTSATPTVQIDNDRVRVTEWRFAPGAETGWHRHEMDYIVVPLVDGEVRIEAPESEPRIVAMKAGASYAREVGVHHNVISINDFEFAFVEIELK